MIWRVVTWNLLGAKGPDLAAVAVVIVERAPDVVALQEVRRRQARDLARRLGWHVEWIRKHYPYTPLLWWRAEGMAIVSPHALAEVTRASLTPDISTWTYRHRVMIAATVRRAAGDALRLYDLHLSGDSADRRIAQARTVAEHVARSREVAIIAGDLNVMEGDVVEVLREFAGAGLADPGGDDTNPSIAPVQRLDYVLLPADASVSAVETPDGGDWWQALSDHLPVTVAFTLP